MLNVLNLRCTSMFIRIRDVLDYNNSLNKMVEDFVDNTCSDIYELGF
jgi:hypothetical protein